MSLPLSWGFPFFFATPSHIRRTVQRISQQLITKGRVDHPYLGIQMVTLTPEIKATIKRNSGELWNLRADQGVLLIDIARSPASIGLKW
ncbi:hypothetical protein A2T98_21435 [Nodularia spumigena CENA596]|uniref:Uncharacterized protein n=1 Tax=Nodularia spumigena CENA596 TaxID=1819295 RepID=A0A166I2L3_NODSP|nr:hypothetical protein A2T98_21435 [Nodularia spumigena CENA596]